MALLTSHSFLGYLIFYISCGGQLILEVLFTWKGLGLWSNTQSEDKNISEDDQLKKKWKLYYGKR